VRVMGGVVEDGVHARFEIFGDDVLQATGSSWTSSQV